MIKEGLLPVFVGRGGSSRIRRALVLSAVTLSVFCLTILALYGTFGPRAAATLQAPIPAAATMAPLKAPMAEFASVDRFQLRAGQAPATAMSEQGLDSGLIHGVMRAMGEMVSLRGLRPRDVFYLYRTRTGEFQRLELERSPETLCVVRLQGDDLVGE